mgnify:FL=1
MKLKDLKKRDGSGAWPEQAPKLYDKDDQHMNISGYEDALEELGSLNLCVDVEALAKVVHEEFCYQPYWKSLSNWDKARMAKDKENSEIGRAHV